MSEPCGHNSYWTTAYQNCVLCENAALRTRIAELEHCVAGQGERLHDYCRKYAALVAERDEAQRKYALIHDDVDYQQCCAVREQAEQERDQAQAMLARQKESA